MYAFVNKIQHGLKQEKMRIFFYVLNKHTLGKIIVVATK